MFWLVVLAILLLWLGGYLTLGGGLINLLLLVVVLAILYGVFVVGRVR